MKAVILAGGLGTRMHPLTCEIPKPMLPFANKPIMQHTIELLKKHGITEIVAILYHQPDLIMNYFGDGSEYGVKIVYVIAPVNYGTAGAVKYAEQHLDGTFIVLSADVITDFDLNKIIEHHKQKKALVTITLTKVENPIPYGIVVTDNDGRIKHFLEKPSWGEVITDTINTGIYVINPSALKQVPDAKEFDFSKDLFPKLLEGREPIYGFTIEGYWKDIGSLLEYSQSHGDIATGKLKMESRNISDPALISPSAELIGLVIIGKHTVIGDNVTIKNSVIGDNCEISKGCKIIDSILWDKVLLGADVNINKAVVASNNKIGDRSFVDEGAIIASGCTFGPESHTKPYVKIWPGKKIEEGSTVSTSIVWRERWTKKIFGAYGVTGICNVEITPEFAATLGAAYGVMLGRGAHITTSRDPHRSSRMIYRAIISGVLSAGVNVSDLEMVPIPINRYELKALKSSGGFHVRRSPFDNQVTDIKFFDAAGMDLPPGKEKQVERLFFGEDFERASMDETGELSFPFFRVAEQYKEGLISFVDGKVIANKKPKIVIDYAYGSAAQIFPSILGDLGCDVIALNAHIDEKKITKSKDEFDKSLRQLAQIVVTLSCDFGILFDAGAEKIFLVDENGNIISGDEALALMVYLNLKHNGKKVIATPVTSSRVIDDIAKQFKGKVIRTKTSSRAMTDAGSDPDVAFIGERIGGYIFPKFQASFDAMLSTAKLLEYITKENRTISKVIKDLPKTHLCKLEIGCNNAQKGKVMRQIIEASGDNSVELLDGVKIYHKKDWALVLPDPDREIVTLRAEAADEGDCNKLIDQYSEKIHKAIK